MNDKIDATHLRYLQSMERIASSLELLAYDHADDYGKEHTSELVDIITRLHRFIEKFAKRRVFGNKGVARMH